MTDTLQFPFAQIPDPTTGGRIIYNGKIYIGDPDTDPTNAVNQVRCFYLNEAEVEIDLSQPISTNTNGLTVNPSGDFITVKIDTEYNNYSLAIHDRNDVEQYYIANMKEVNPEINLSQDLSQAYEFATLTDAVSSTINFPTGKVIHIKERTSGNGGAATWDVVLTSSVVPNGYDVVQSVGTPSLSLKLRRSGVISYSVPNDFDNLNAALNYISSIKQDSFTSINLSIDSGLYTFNETTVIPNQNSEKLSITGSNSDTVSLTGYVGATGSERDFFITVSVSQASDFTIGRYCICTVTGGDDDNHYLVRGCWEVTQKSGNNITLRVTHKISTFPAITSLSGEITPLNTVLKYIDVDGIVSRGANLGNLNNLAVVGNSDDYWDPNDVSGTEKGTHGIYVSGLTVIGQQANKGSIGGGSITCGIEGEGRVGVNGFDQQGFVTDMNGAIFNYTCAASNNKRRGMYVAGGKIRCKFGAATGNYLDGIIADYGNSFEGSGICASGNGSAGVSSANGSSLTAPNSFYTHNQENAKAVKGGYLEVTNSFYSDSISRDITAENGGIVISNNSTFSSSNENIKAVSSSYIRVDDSNFTESGATHINAQESTIYHSDATGVNNTSTVNSILRDNSTYGNYRAGYLIEGLAEIYATGEIRINHQSNPVYSRMVPTSGGDLVLGSNTANALTLRNDGLQTYPSVGDDLCDLGRADFRFKDIYAGNGTINTSDAREKTEVSELTPSEISAAKQLSKEIGGYKWLSSVASKGDNARYHIGMTVQRAIEIMESFDLDPMSYGFICYDEWEAEEAGIDDDGSVIVKAKEPGNRYGFRYSQLNMFILAGINARLESAGI